MIFYENLAAKISIILKAGFVFPAFLTLLKERCVTERIMVIFKLQIDTGYFD